PAHVRAVALSLAIQSGNLFPPCRGLLGQLVRLANEHCYASTTFRAACQRGNRRSPWGVTLKSQAVGSGLIAPQKLGLDTEADLVRNERNGERQPPVRASQYRGRGKAGHIDV